MDSAMKLGKPGPMRDRLVASVLAGTKTATTSLRVAYEDEGLEIPAVGQRRQLLDSSDEPAATVEVTEVHVIPIGQVGEEIAEAEGAGFDSVAEYRRRHETFWAAETLPNLKRTPAPTLDDDTEVVVLRFKVVEED